MRTFAAELIGHIGGRPSVVQRRLIQRAAVLHLRLCLMDQATEPGGEMTEKNAREYLCWHNAYVRTIAALGLHGAPQKGPSLRAYLDSKAGASAPP